MACSDDFYGTCFSKSDLGSQLSIANWVSDRCSLPLSPQSLAGATPIAVCCFLDHSSRYFALALYRDRPRHLPRQNTDPEFSLRCLVELANILVASANLVLFPGSQQHPFFADFV